ncbi:MAG: hypothetical protein IT200_11080 [Thermoleophilia bacterium]|nr:hypothetical protein [Thermoleophilia bacterium]
MYEVDVPRNRLVRPGRQVAGRVLDAQQGGRALWVVTSRGVFVMASWDPTPRRVGALPHGLVPVGQSSVTDDGARYRAVLEDRATGAGRRVLVRFADRGGPPAVRRLRGVRGVAGVTELHGAVWVVVSGDRAPWGRVIAFDATTLEPLGGWPLPGLPAGVARRGGQLWVTVRRPGASRFRLVRFDPRTRRVAGAVGPLPGVPSSVGIGGATVWVTTDRTVYRVAAVGERVIGRSGAGLLFPSVVAAGPSGAWATTRDGLARIDARTGAVRGGPAPFTAHPVRR